MNIEATSPNKVDKKADVEMIDTEVKKEEVKVENPEPEEQILKNPSRVLKAQEKVIAFKHDASVRYTPVLESRFAGFVVLSDLGA